MTDIWAIPQPATTVAVTALADALDPVPVMTMLPKTLPVAFIRVSRIGGNLQNPVTDRARLLIECWAAGNSIAEALANQARAALKNLAGTTSNGAFIRGWDNEDGVVDFPDPSVTDRSRYQFTGDLLISTSPALGS